MPISNIDQTISTIPAAGHRGVDVQTIFVNKQEDFQDHLSGTLVDELNALVTEINTTSGQMNTAVTAVSTSETNAATSATNAANSAASASSSATSASSSATSATSSKNAAASSATNAASSATSASTSASSATTKASEAATSATNAASSATTATTKASQAATSATNAANSATSASNDLASIEGILATLPDGSVNDTLIGTDKAYSNQTLQQVVGNINSPLLDLDFSSGINMKAGKGGVTFSRASTATYIDRYGVLQYASIDEPRFEKDGLLIEGESTNHVTKSSDLSFDNNFWKVRNSALTTETTSIKVQGSSRDTYTKVVSAGTFDYTYLYNLTTLSVSGSSITYQVKTKKGTTNSARITIYSPTEGNIAFLWLDFTTGGITVSNYGGEVGSVVNIGEDEYLLTLTVNGTTATAAGCFVYPYEIAKDGAYVSGYTYFAHPQLEALPFASSYIPTTSSAVTRSADKVSAGYYNNFIAWDKPLSIAFKYTPIKFNNRINNLVFSTGDLSSYINFSSTGSLIANLQQGVVVTATFSQVAVSTNAVVTSDGITVKLYLGGSLISSGSVGTTQSIVNKIYIGSDASFTQQLGTKLGYFKIYNKELTATEVALLG